MFEKRLKEISQGLMTIFIRYDGKRKIPKDGKMDE